MFCFCSSSVLLLNQIMSWFYLALLAPLLFAIVNLIDDNLLRFVYKGPYLAAAASGIFGALPLISLLFVDWTPITISQAGVMLLAGFLTAIYYFFYFKSLAVESPSVVIAIMSLVPATLPVLAYFLLDERLTSAQFTGFTVVLIASLGLAMTEVKKFKFSAALVPALVVVGIVDITSLLTKYVYEQAAFYPAFICFSIGLGLGGVYFALIMFFDHKKHDLSVFKKSIHKLFVIFIMVELLAVAAEFTSNLAVSRGAVSLVRVVEGIQPMYVLLIALVLYPLSPKHFREAAEGQLAKKFALMAIITAGLFLIGATA